MPTPILMPQLSPTMEEGTLAKWHVKEGDKVRSGDIVADIETDKATMELEAAEDWVIEKLLLAGVFDVDASKFTDAGVQKKLSGMSHRARGRDPATPSTGETLR